MQIFYRAIYFFYVWSPFSTGDSKPCKAEVNTEMEPMTKSAATTRTGRFYKASPPCPKTTLGFDLLNNLQSHFSFGCLFFPTHNHLRKRSHLMLYWCPWRPHKHRDLLVIHWIHSETICCFRVFHLVTAAGPSGTTHNTSIVLTHRV